jgi:molybdopterin molybdotransferase
MIPLEQARALALHSVEVGRPIRAPLNAAYGRFLADSMPAPRSLPNFDNSAMDGYAVASSATVGANRDRPARLRIVETIYAGAIPTRAIGEGEAARIFTGAPVPQGADCVVRQEAARADGDQALVFVETGRGDNIRRKGEELAEGDPVLTVGQRLNAYAIGVFASLGVQSISVWPAPTVAILTVGDELVAPGGLARSHQVFNCNAALLSALCVEVGAAVVAVEQAPDQEGPLREALRRLATSADVLITSGGASFGDKDLVKRTLRSLGAATVFDGIAMKPGKPAAVALLDGHPVVTLPGNPGAAAVGFDQLARPMLFKRQGVLETRQTVRATLGSRQLKQGGLTYLLSARLTRGERGLPVAIIRPQGSGQLLQNVGAEGWVVLPPGRADFAEGEEATMELFAGATFSAAPGGQRPTGGPELAR